MDGQKMHTDLGRGGGMGQDGDAGSYEHWSGSRCVMACG